MSAAAPFASFSQHRTVLVTTFRRDGTPVDTPVHIAFRGDRAFIRTYEAAWKTRRLRRSPEAELWHATSGRRPAVVALLAPSRTHRTGPPLRVRAIELEGADERLAAASIRRRYPILHRLIPLMHRAMRTRTVHFELLAAAEGPPDGTRLPAAGG